MPACIVCSRPLSAIALKYRRDYCSLCCDMIRRRRLAERVLQHLEK
jgi:hypothetical protein